MLTYINNLRQKLHVEFNKVWNSVRCVTAYLYCVGRSAELNPLLEEDEQGVQRILVWLESVSIVTVMCCWLDYNCDDDDDDDDDLY